MQNFLKLPLCRLPAFPYTPPRMNARPVAQPISQTTSGLRHGFYPRPGKSYANNPKQPNQKRPPQHAGGR